MSRIFLGNDEVSAAWASTGVTTIERLREVLNQWHKAHRTDWATGYRTSNLEWKANFDTHEEKHAHIGAKYVRLDTGTSGAWMLEISTGNIFGIKGYGQVDRAKCAGNILDPSFNGAVLFKDRFRYGRFDNRKAV